MKHSKNTLEQLGLTDGEIKIYKAGLSIGSATAAKLAKEAKLSRTLAYHILEQLSDKGLVSNTGKSLGKRFRMEPPERLRDLVARKREALEMLDNDISHTIHELALIQSEDTSTPHIRFYKGIQGIYSVYEENMRAENGLICSFIDANPLLGAFAAKDFDKIVRLRKKANMQSKSIWSEKPPEGIVPKDDPSRTARLFPNNDELQSTISVWDDKVLVLSVSGEKSAFVIKDKKFANTMKSIFNIVWDNSKTT